MFDLLGFGLSEKPRDQLYSLLMQADIVEAVVARYAREPVILVAHDMGSSVATELLARDLDQRLTFELSSVLLFNASLVLERESSDRSESITRSSGTAGGADDDGDRVSAAVRAGLLQGASAE